MFEDKIKDEIQSSVSACFGKHIKIDEINIEKPTEKSFGDFSSNISFKLAGELKKSPVEIAEALSVDLNSSGSFEKVESKAGFLNFTLSRERYANILSDILKQGKNYANSTILKGKKIQAEFISANPTGPLTLANGRGGFGGDVLANVLAKNGAKVEREYYVNDGGNQVRILGESILVSAGLLKRDENIYRGQYIEDWAKANPEKIEKFQTDSFALGKLAAKDILAQHIKPSVKAIDINFDNWFSEDAMIKKGEAEEAITKLKKFGHTFEEDGALWMRTTEFGDDKDRVLVKSDGEKTYFANDVAYHFDKLYKRKYDLIINFWGADHHGYVPRMLAAVSAMGCPSSVRIVTFQLVKLIKSGKEYKMSKRKGTYITMDDLLELIGGTTKEASDVARFFFLSRSFNTHMDFDLDLAKERSEKNPVFYVKYAYARIHGILAQNTKSKTQNTKTDPALLVEGAELELIDKLSELPSLVEYIATSESYPVHLLTSYAIEVAKKFHHFYDKCRVIDEENPALTAARLELVRATQNILLIVGQDLIGLDMPERM
jgi:arginyl-tRNA synthetase